MKKSILALLLAMAALATAGFAEAGVIGEFNDLVTGEKKLVYEVVKGDTCWGIFRKLFPEKAVSPANVAKEIRLPNGIANPRKLAIGTILIVTVEKGRASLAPIVSKEVETGKAEAEKMADLERENVNLEQEAVQLHEVITDLERALQASDQEKGVTEKALYETEERLRGEEARGIYISKPPLGSIILFATSGCIILWMLYVTWSEKGTQRTKWQLSKEEAEEARHIFKTVDRQIFLDEEIRRLIENIGKEEDWEYDPNFFGQNKEAKK